MPDEQGLYSPVLSTWVRIHEEAGFQCQDPATGRWIEADASFYDEGYGEGYGEGYSEGQYRERRQSLLALAEVLCTAQELADLRVELEAVDPQAWPSIKDLYGRYRPYGEGSR